MKTDVEKAVCEAGRSDLPTEGKDKVAERRFQFLKSGRRSLGQVCGVEEED
jgi:hypothetical protein